METVLLFSAVSFVFWLSGAGGREQTMHSWIRLLPGPMSYRTVWQKGTPCISLGLTFTNSNKPNHYFLHRWHSVLTHHHNPSAHSRPTLQGRFWYIPQSEKHRCRRQTPKLSSIFQCKKLAPLTLLWVEQGWEAQSPIHSVSNTSSWLRAILVWKPLN